MKLHTRLLFISLFGFMNCYILKSQDINESSDSLIITRIINEFYEWYMTSIIDHKYDEFQPIFIEDANGMTTLNFDKYLGNLIKYKFCDSLIIWERNSYNECLKNLSDVRYSEFKQTVFTDLDEYEQANCDFGNYYRWTGGQEPKERMRISRILIEPNNITATVTIEFGYFNTMEKKYNYYGSNGITLHKVNNIWYICDIGSWR